MTIYVDVVLLENLCMNYIILFGTGYIIKLKMKHLRIFLSSVLGAIYAILAYAGILPMYANIFVKIILSLCMVYIAYNPKTIKGMLKELVVFYLVSFATFWVFWGDRVPLGFFGEMVVHIVRRCLSI